MHPFARLSFVFAVLVIPSHALITGPYAPDENTIHLFHLDEASSATVAANAVPSAASAIAFDGDPAANHATAAQATNTTILGAASGLSGFAAAAQISASDLGLGLDANSSNGFQLGTASVYPDAISQSSLAGSGGEFTVEALIKLPAITGSSREIVSTDSGLSSRGFQFRINTSGQLEFNFIATAPAGVTAAIPTSGLHAFNSANWYHVAVTHDGTTTRLYWTLADPSVTTANEIGNSTTETTNGAVTGPLVIGNEGRSASGEGLRGLIDEVRISNIARSPSQFLFTTNDSDGDGLDDAWEVTYFDNIAAQAGSGDPDHDGYTNEQEETAGTIPNSSASNPGDSDSDGLADDWETTHFGNITAQDGSGDPDGDFATNLQEFSAATLPNGPLSFPDTDNDLLNDGWEVFYFANLSHDGTADSDLDGSTDQQEHDANSNPNNPLWSATTAMLAHRWSFNGDLNDTSGSTTATIEDPDGNASAGGTATLSATDVLLEGGTYGSSAYVKLGNGGLLAGRRTPVTLEFWATRVSALNWSRIFDFGSSSSEYLFMSWTRGTSTTQDRVEWKDAVTSGANDTIAPYVAGTPYHIVMTVEPRAGASGTTRVTWYAAPASDSTLGPAQGTFDTANTLLDLNDPLDYLGRSQYSADSTANARYDEVRLWDGVVPPATLDTQQLMGPDVVSAEDSDHDDLPDAWEMNYFSDLDETGSGDSDSDGYTNATEFSALSNPALTASTPLDMDADGLADTWETHYFGSISATPDADPDGDGETNASEQANASAPNHRASLSTDIDADALPDSWELSHFPDLSLNGGADPDGDGFGNLQEYQAATNPADVASRPPGVAVRLVPLDDGDHATSDFGYAGASAINSVAFVRSSIKTIGNQQFITWYGRHQYDSAAAYNNTIWIGRRTLGSSQWEIFRHPTFTANTITDGHDVICYGIDGDGYMHVSWGMHGDAFHYAKSTTPVTGSGPITLGPDGLMTGTESTVTYPQFLKLPGGDLLFIFREVASGNGDTYVNRYSIATQTWSNVHGSASTQSPFIKGTGWTPNYNAYLNMPQLGGPDGDDLILTWCWRYEPVGGDSPAGQDGYQTNNNLNFARSPDAGATWQRFDGTAYSLPITRDLEISTANKAEIIVPIPEGSSLINQASTCLDHNDNPVTCTWWAPETPSGNFRRQYMVVFRDDNGTPDPGDDSWQTRAVSNRITDPTGTRYAENHVRDVGRPILVNDDDDRVIVAYRDNQANNIASVDSSLSAGVSNGLTIVHSLPKADDPHRLVWIQFDLTTENLGNYEPIIDNELWDRDRQLHFLYQPAEGQGYTAPANLASRFSVLEWDALSYFAHNPQPSVALSGDQSQITITCPSQPSWGYRLWTSDDLEDWQVVETRAGTGEPLVFTQAANSGETRRFWRVEFKEGGF